MTEKYKSYTEEARLKEGSTKRVGDKVFHISDPTIDPMFPKFLVFEVEDIEDKKSQS